MNWIASIFKMANQNWTSRAFTLVLIGLIAFSGIQVFKAKAKIKCQDCTPYQKIAQDLIDAFKGKGTAYEPQQTNYTFAVYYDTLKPMTKIQWEKYRDSVLQSAQKKIDSLKRKQQ